MKQGNKLDVLITNAELISIHKAIAKRYKEEAEYWKKRLYLYDCWCEKNGVIPTEDDIDEMERIYWDKSFEGEDK